MIGMQLHFPSNSKSHSYIFYTLTIQNGMNETQLSFGFKVSVIQGFKLRRSHQDEEARPLAGETLLKEESFFYVKCKIATMQESLLFQLVFHFLKHRMDQPPIDASFLINPIIREFTKMNRATRNCRIGTVD
jgi:hypothetical protein